MFKKLIMVASLIVTPVMAETVTADIEDVYRNDVRRTPHTEQVCEDVQVPVYRQGGNSNGNAGAVILGGIIGNAIGAASGIGDGRTLGTVIGGIAGNEMSKDSAPAGVDHYRIEQRCRTVTTYTTETQQVYSHSIIRFQHPNGRWFETRFRK